MSDAANRRVPAPPTKVYLRAPLARLTHNHAFVICVVLLAFCAGGLHVLADQLGMYLRKETVPLKNRLQDLDVDQLGDYQVVQRIKIKDEVEEELGTQDYIQWVLEDTSAPTNDPRRYVSFFVTYYTGDPDRVPHVPEVCYPGGGNQVVGRDNTSWTIPDNGTSQDGMPVRIIDTKVRPQGSWDWHDRTIAYFFAVNGEYKCTRNQVRLRLKSWKERYAYFSKVEMSLVREDGLEREEVLAALQKLARQLTPILVEQHWPDWQAVNDPEGAGH